MPYVNIRKTNKNYRLWFESDCFQERAIFLSHEGVCFRWNPLRQWGAFTTGLASRNVFAAVARIRFSQIP